MKTKKTICNKKKEKRQQQQQIKLEKNGKMKMKMTTPTPPETNEETIIGGRRALLPCFKQLVKTKNYGEIKTLSTNIRFEIIPVTPTMPDDEDNGKQQPLDKIVVLEILGNDHNMNKVAPKFIGEILQIYAAVIITDFRLHNREQGGIYDDRWKRGIVSFSIKSFPYLLSSDIPKSGYTPCLKLGDLRESQISVHPSIMGYGVFTLVRTTPTTTTTTTLDRAAPLPPLPPLAAAAAEEEEEGQSTMTAIYIDDDDDDNNIAADMMMMVENENDNDNDNGSSAMATLLLLGSSSGGGEQEHEPHQQQNEVAAEEEEEAYDWDSLLPDDIPLYPPPPPPPLPTTTAEQQSGDDYDYYYCYENDDDDHLLPSCDELEKLFE